MSLNKYDIARRFIALPAEKRSAFLQVLAQKGIDFSRLPIVPAVPADSAMPLSFAQQRMWFLEQMQPGQSAYHIPALLQLDGVLNRTALDASFNALIARHAALRTTFHARSDGQAEQRIYEAASLNIIETDLSTLSSTQQHSELERITEQETRQAFDLSIGPLLRVHLFKFNASVHFLLLVQHHIISDGWSVALLLEEFALCYCAFVQGKQPNLPELPIQYSDYALWQRHWLDAGERERELAWWRATLGTLVDESPVLQLPTDYPRLTSPSLRGARHTVVLDEACSAALRTLAQNHEATLFMVLLAAYHLLLWRLSGQTEICVGVSVAGRTRREAENVVGLFVNIQVLPAQLKGEMRFTELLAQIKTAVLGAQAHQELPFDVLVDALKIKRNVSYNPLVQVKFTQQIALPELIDLPELTAKLRPLPDHAARFDLSLDVTECTHGIEAIFNYATDLFDAATAEGFADSYVSILKAVAATPEIYLAGLQIPCQPADFMLRGESLPHPPTSILSAWAQSVALQNHAIAVRDETQSISFAELDNQSNRLARFLQAHGVGVEQRVAICATRSVPWVIGILAVLKTGAAYLPLDPQLPPARLSLLLRNSGVQCVLTDAIGAQAVIGAEMRVISLETEPTWTNYDTTPLTKYPPADAAAYVIYTSGSTGQPKGVVISHRALATYVSGMLARFQLPKDSSMALVSSVSADLGHTMLFGALCSGRTLHLLSVEHAFDPDHFAAYMDAHQVGVLKIVPSHLQGLLAAANPAAVLPRHALILGGEALPWSLLERVRTLHPNCQVFNHYGPTETTVGILTQDATQSSKDIKGASVPLGRPLPYGEAYILNSDLNPVPRGSTGELYLGGPGLARGYLERPDLTAERFIPHPWADGARLYRTGDLVRMLPNGLLDFLGRVDDQVKIRGYRVELSEVASALRSLPGVAMAEALFTVLNGDTNHQQLIGYVVPDVGKRLVVDEIKQALTHHLPDYMCPTYFFILENMPLTANGKVDRKALPLPNKNTSSINLTKQNAYSRNEQILLEIWQAVLGITAVGLHDNFFSLGGDSILSLQIIARARKQGLKLTPKQLFEQQTISELALVATAIDSSSAKAFVTSSRPFTQEVLSLTPAQLRFFTLNISNRHHWNQALCFSLRERIDPACLQRAFIAVLEQHPSLRCCYQDQYGRWRAYVMPLSATDILWLRPWTSETQWAAVCDEAHRSLNLDRGELLRAVLAESADGTQFLFITIHHLAVDGVSWRILIDDLDTAYRQLTHEKLLAPVLPAPSSPSNAWAMRLMNYANSDALAAELPYWTALADAPIAFPRDIPVETGLLSDSMQVEMKLNSNMTQRLLNATSDVYSLLLSALIDTLSRFTACDKVLIELEGHGREALFEDIDLSRTIGWFTSHFPVCFQVKEQREATLKEVQDTLRQIPCKGIGFGILQYLACAEWRSLITALPRPRVTFNYLGQFANHPTDQTLLHPIFGTSGTERDSSGSLTNWLAIHGQINANELVLNWVFSRKMYRKDTIQCLVDEYRQELLSLITQSVAQSDNILQSNHFPLTHLKPAELASLPVFAHDIADIYPAAPLQQGLLFHAQLTPGDMTYINQLSMRLTDPDVARLAAAWQAAVKRHDILRTGFWYEGVSVPQQVLYHNAHLSLDYHDWRGKEDSSAALIAFTQAERQRPFDLLRPPLMRLALLRLTEHHYHLIWTRHHLLLDGWSTAQLWSEVLQHYAGTPLAPLSPLRYRDYIAWLITQSEEASRRFWQTRLSQLKEVTRLVQQRHHNITGYETIQRQWCSANYAQIQEAARAARITLNTLIQGAWGLLLQRYTGQHSVVFGSTVAGRPPELAGIENVLGLFINTLPVQLTPLATQTGGEWLRAVQADNITLREYAHTPLFDIQRWAGQSGQALFDSLIVFENYPVAREWNERHATSLQFDQLANVEATNYPLTLVITQGDTLAVEYGFDRSYFNAVEIENLHNHFAVLLTELAQNLDRPLGTLSLLTHQEQTQLMTWNATAMGDTLAFNAIHRDFERQAQSQPDAVALLFGTQSMNYRELDQRANQLAHRLRALGVTSDDPVAICMERSFELVISLLGVLKAGAAYVPIDPRYPKARRVSILADAQPVLLLTQSTLCDDIDGEVPLLCLDNEDLSSYPQDVLVLDPHPDQLAYLLYTSGSTGQPKGVGNTHGALHNRLQWMQTRYGLTESDTVLQKTPFSFDVSVWEFFWPLMFGARLAIAAPEDHQDPVQIAALIEQHTVTVLHFVPSMLHAFLANGVDSRRFSQLRHIISSGEPLSAKLAAHVKNCLPHIELHNLYGPTEAAIDVTHRTYQHDDVDSVPIGLPIHQTQIHILDDALNPLPPGVKGELYIGGIGLARGYLRKAALTAASFIPDPFQHGARLYRSGDLARWRVDGVLEYLGRIDGQVKLRGQRIELGEIEAQLLSHPAVQEAVVQVFSGEQLIAYVVLKQECSKQLLLDYLAAHLPHFMLPAQLILLEAMPLNFNGKLDRKALPEPVWQSDSQAIPLTHTEQQLAAIWCQVLGIEQVGRRDHFFRLGGHSLSATQVISRLKQELQLSIPLRQVFDTPILADFACMIDQAATCRLNENKLDILDALLDEMEAQ